MPLEPPAPPPGFQPPVAQNPAALRQQEARQRAAMLEGEFIQPRWRVQERVKARERDAAVSLNERRACATSPPSFFLLSLSLATPLALPCLAAEALVAIARFLSSLL